MGSVLSILLVTVAFAGPTDDRFCFDFTNLAFTDGDVGDVLTGSSLPAYGLKVAFRRGSASKIYYLDDTGADGGCVDADLVQGADYTVKIYYRANVTGNTVSVHNSSGAQYTQTLPGIYEAQSGSTTHVSINATNTQHFLVGMIEAIRQHDVGVTGRSFPIWVEPGQAGWREGAKRIHFDPAMARYKFTIAHELGHGLSDFANNGQGFATNYSGGMGPCAPNYSGTHTMVTKEHQSAAATEGIGHFYSAIAWNYDHTPTSDCDLYNFKPQDWNLDGVYTGQEWDYAFPCDKSFTREGHVVPATDFLHDFCMSSGPTKHRGTELDWLRMFWDLRTERGWGNDRIFDVWDRANPHSWSADHTLDGSKAVHHRMENAADHFGLLGDYLAESRQHGTSD